MSLIRALHNDIRTTFLSDEEWGGQHGWAFMAYVHVFGGASAEMSAGMQPMRAGNSEGKKGKEVSPP